MIKRLLLSFLAGWMIFGLAPTPTWATLYYLAPAGSGGSDSNDGLTTGTPWLTFGKFAATATAGDDLELAIGTHTASSINGFSGTSGNHTHVYCATSLGCTIKRATPIDISGSTYSYMDIDGFFLWGTGETPSLSINSPDSTALASQSHHINVSTTFGYSEILTNNNSSGWDISRLSSCTFTHTGSIGSRYATLVYGCLDMVFNRQLVSWKTWAPTGDNPAGGLSIYDVHNSTFTHMFVHDASAYAVITDTNVLDQLGIYVVSNNNGVTSPFTDTINIYLYSGLVINNYLGHCFGNEGGGSGGANSNVNLKNFALLGCMGAGITVPNRSTGFLADHVTIASAVWNTSSAAIYTGGGGSSVTGSTITSSNIAFSQADGMNGGWSNTNTNVYGSVGDAYSGGAVAGTGATATNPVFVHAMISTSTALAGLGVGGTDMGADLRFAYDNAGNATATKLWPWPNECAIKDFYSRTIGLTYGVFGTTYTYTTYAWRWLYGVNPPADYASTCADVDVTSPTAPTDLSTTSVTTSSIDISWTASTDAVGVTDYRIDVSTHNNFSEYIGSYTDLTLGVVTSYSITGLDASTTYYFRLRAKDAIGNTSSNSSTQSGVTSTPAPKGTTGSGSFSGSGSFR